MRTAPALGHVCTGTGPRLRRRWATSRPRIRRRCSKARGSARLPGFSSESLPRWYYLNCARPKSLGRDTSKAASCKTAPSSFRRCRLVAPLRAHAGRGVNAPNLAWATGTDSATLARACGPGAATSTSSTNLKVSLPTEASRLLGASASPEHRRWHARANLKPGRPLAALGVALRCGVRGLRCFL